VEHARIHREVRGEHEEVEEAPAASPPHLALPERSLVPVLPSFGSSPGAGGTAIVIALVMHVAVHNAVTR
jgi:hypothetical protein